MNFFCDLIDPCNICTSMNCLAIIISKNKTQAKINITSLLSTGELKNKQTIKPQN